MNPERLWYGRSPWSQPLRPLGFLVCLAARLRRWAWRRGLRPVERLPVPVIVVGNITVGGTGKTPLVIWLARYLLEAGMRPGLVSRGYGGRARSWPQQVRPDSDPGVVGDEAILLTRGTGCPMAAGPDRVAAARALLAHHDCDVIISDDGLQHYRLGRDLEIAVVDGIRRHGNRRCLPAGPLREPVTRLDEVDFVVNNGGSGRLEYPMRLRGERACRLQDPGQCRRLDSFAGPVHAVAGIGNPRRFFDLLRSQGLEVIPHPFPDHHRFRRRDLEFGDDLPVLMTEKDAVKCRAFGLDGLWSVAVRAEVDRRLGPRILERLGRAPAEAGPAPARRRDTDKQP